MGELATQTGTNNPPGSWTNMDDGCYHSSVLILLLEL